MYPQSTRNESNLFKFVYLSNNDATRSEARGGGIDITRNDLNISYDCSNWKGQIKKSPYILLKM